MSFRSRAEIFVIAVCVSLLVAASAYLSNSSTSLDIHLSLSLSILILEKGLGVARIFGDPLLVFLDLSTRVNFQSDDDDSQGDKDRYIFVTFVT